MPPWNLRHELPASHFQSEYQRLGDVFHLPVPCHCSHRLTVQKLLEMLRNVFRTPTPAPCLVSFLEDPLASISMSILLFSIYVATHNCSKLWLDYFVIFQINWGSQDPLSFSDLLEGFTELRKAVLLRVTVYYSEMIQVSEGKRCPEWSPGESGHKLPAVPSRQSCTKALNSPSNHVWQHVGSTVNHGSSPKPRRPGFLL